MKYKNNLKGTWCVIKEVTGKKKVNLRFVNKLIADNKEITDTSFIADIGSKLTSKILQTNKHHLQYINTATSLLQQIEISEEEFRTAYFSLKKSKSSGYDSISPNVFRAVYSEIQKPLLYFFQRCFN